jgi:hypothetical protein
VPTSTHDVAIGPATVEKRFTAWARGEPDREWRALAALAAHAPGLAPEPVRRTEDGGRPVVVMGRLPGAPLGLRPLTTRQVAAVVAAVSQLHAAVPAAEVERFPLRVWHPAEALAAVRAASADTPRDLAGDVRRAVLAGTGWIRSADAAALATDDHPPVLGQADGNIANVLWDGHRCRLVDFEDSGRSDPAFEVADLIEHPSTRLRGVLAADELLALLAPDPATARRLRRARRLLALHWLLALLPGRSAHRRNPPGSDRDQAHHLLDLLG